MFEHLVVDDWDVKNREDGDETGHDTPEQELVTPNIVEPLGEVLLRARLHAEKGAAHVHHLPGQEQGEPGQAGKAGGSGTEDGVASSRVVVVAVHTKVSIAPGVEDQAETS